MVGEVKKGKKRMNNNTLAHQAFLDQKYAEI